MPGGILGQTALVWIRGPAACKLAGFDGEAGLPQQPLSALGHPRDVALPAAPELLWQALPVVRIDHVVTPVERPAGLEDAVGLAEDLGASDAAEDPDAGDGRDAGIAQDRATRVKGGEGVPQLAPVIRPWGRPERAGIAPYGPNRGPTNPPTPARLGLLLATPSALGAAAAANGRWMGSRRWSTL